ncbi:MAG: ferrochelatase [Alphaproteobacteria bacterium]|nr:ferrochelatase [Alphaproteobacteria bacterium]
MTGPNHKPSDHPQINTGKIGVLIANLGTPDGTDYWSMRRYLNEFLSDQRVIDYPRWKWQPLLQLIILTKRPFSSGRAYRSIWNDARNEGPLLTTTRVQSEKLAEALTTSLGDKVMVDFCMRYGNPSTKSKVERMLAAGCDRILFFPLYPQYAGASTATANDQFFAVLAAAKWQPAVRTVPAYYDHELYIKALVQSVEVAYEGLKIRPDALVASFHGMPERYLAEGDPYFCQCTKTARLLSERLGWPDGQLITSFQSKFGPEEWLKPATVDEVARLARSGIKNIAMIAPAFSADCLETLEEINKEIRHSFINAGGETFTYIPCLNADAAHIGMMAEIVKTNLLGWI